jgi:hypothetical protein
VLFENDGHLPVFSFFQKAKSLHGTAAGALDALGRGW